MPKKKTSLIRSPDFRTVYAVGAIGSWTPYDFRINFYSEKVVEDDGEAYLNDTQVILSPQATKEFAYWLMQNINDYEVTYGKTGSRAGKSTQRPDESVFKGDLRAEMKDEIKNELQNELKMDLKRVLKADLKKDLRKDIKPELRKDLKQSLREDIKRDIREELKHNLRGTTATTTTPTPTSTSTTTPTTATTTAQKLKPKSRAMGGVRGSRKKVDDKKNKKKK